MSTLSNSNAGKIKYFGDHAIQMMNSKVTSSFKGNTTEAKDKTFLLQITLVECQKNQIVGKLCPFLISTRREF